MSALADISPTRSRLAAGLGVLPAWLLAAWLAGSNILSSGSSIRSALSDFAVFVPVLLGLTLGSVLTAWITCLRLSRQDGALTYKSTIRAVVASAALIQLLAALCHLPVVQFEEMIFSGLGMSEFSPTPKVDDVAMGSALLVGCHLAIWLLVTFPLAILGSSIFRLLSGSGPRRS